MQKSVSLRVFVIFTSVFDDFLLLYMVSGQCGDVLALVVAAIKQWDLRVADAAFACRTCRYSLVHSPCSVLITCCIKGSGGCFKEQQCLAELRLFMLGPLKLVVVLPS